MQSRRRSIRKRSKTKVKAYGLTERQGVVRFKPKGYEDYLTISELANVVDREVSWIKQLERRDRLPLPNRVKVGQLSVRLYSPEMVEEILAIFATHRPGPVPREEDDNE